MKRRIWEGFMNFLVWYKFNSFQPSLFCVCYSLLYLDQNNIIGFSFYYCVLILWSYACLHGYFYLSGNAFNIVTNKSVDYNYDLDVLHQVNAWLLFGYGNFQIYQSVCGESFLCCHWFLKHVYRFSVSIM